MKIKTYKDGSARLVWDWSDIELPTADFAALRAFFQAERDEELGRWRDPENPDWITYPADKEDAVWVFDEREGGGSQYWTRGIAGSYDPAYTGYSASHYAAGRYFQAHPKPKPWDTAEEDEIWVLTIDGYSAPYLRNGYGTWTNSTSDVYVGDGTITAGHRIWPEGEDQ